MIRIFGKEYGIQSVLSKCALLPGQNKNNDNNELIPSLIDITLHSS